MFHDYVYDYGYLSFIIIPINDNYNKRLSSKGDTLLPSKCLLDKYQCIRVLNMFCSFSLLSKWFL